MRPAAWSTPSCTGMRTATRSKGGSGRPSMPIIPARSAGPTRSCIARSTPKAGNRSGTRTGRRDGPPIRRMPSTGAGHAFPAGTLKPSWWKHGASRRRQVSRSPSRPTGSSNSWTAISPRPVRPSTCSPTPSGTPAWPSALPSALAPALRSACSSTARRPAVTTRPAAGVSTTSPRPAPTCASWTARTASRPDIALSTQSSL